MFRNVKSDAHENVRNCVKSKIACMVFLGVGIHAHGIQNAFHHVAHAVLQELTCIGHIFVVRGWESRRSDFSSVLN